MLATELLPFTDDDLDRSVPERLAWVVAARPEALAVAAGAERLTYAELARRSDTLAAAVAARTGGSDAPVAVLLTDPVAMIVGMLATWKAGKICVPLDAILPPARLEVILRESQTEWILTDADGAAALQAFTGRAPRVLRVDAIDRSRHVEPPPTVVAADAVACVLYTSGSTGTPKGVVKTHRNLVDRARCVSTSFDLRPDDRVSALHSPAFFAGLRDVVATLLSGAALFPFDVRQGGLRALAGWIQRERISVLCAVVTTVRRLLASLDAATRFPSVRVVRLGSEPLYRQDVEALRERFGTECVLIAAYGATETNGVAQFRIAPTMPLPAGRIPAGYAVDGVEIVLLGDDGRRARAGETGEIAVRSRQLSPGYWRRPDLTRGAFIADPAGGARLYRTGDIGRLSADGCLDVLGRKDHQLKVRGYLVHPSEIEALLTQHSGVREAAVTAWEAAEGETRLVAYVVPRTSPAPSAAMLRRYLQARLPAYMVPWAFVTLDALPLTTTGKLDRRALPPPPRPVGGDDVDFVAPRSPMEHHIAGIWEELFGVSPIGANDNFFDLGGDSLLAAALMTAIEDTCDRVVSPSVLLDAATVADLAAAVERLEDGFNAPLSALRASGSRTPIFFLHNDYGEGLYTHRLARSLDADRPFYAVHLHGLAEAPMPSTVEEIAARRLPAIRAVRPHGPYILGGHCNGGIVALEMARQLRAQGEDVELVVMIDSAAPPRSRTVRRLLEAVDPTRRRVRYYQGRVAALRAAGLRGLRDVVRRKLAALTRRSIRLLRDKDAWRRPPRTPVPPMDAWQIYRLAIRRYGPPRYVAPVAVFKAERFRGRRADLGWAKHLSHLESAVIPGDHHSCITRDVTAFAARLEDVLRRTERKASAARAYGRHTARPLAGPAPASPIPTHEAQPARD